MDPLADRRRSPTRRAEHRRGRRTGHPLEVVAPPDRDLPDRPTATSPSPSPCNASKMSAQTCTPDWSQSPSRSCCGSCATSWSPAPARADPPAQWSAWRRGHQHRARQAHQRWNAYVETTPWLQRTTAAMA